MHCAVIDCHPMALEMLSLLYRTMKIKKNGKKDVVIYMIKNICLTVITHNVDAVAFQIFPL